MAQEIQFNRDIRPLLSENCFYCHGQDPNHRESNLRLDIGEEARNYGAVVPGDTEQSLLVERINSDDPDLLMPPPDSNRHLNAAQRKTIETWIEQGGQYERHWAYIAPTQPELPLVRMRNWPVNAIDRFVLARLERHGIEPSPLADKATLLKRLSIDLTGLPPTQQQLKEFLDDTSSDAYEKVVDRLLASPHYGERMALPWLDAARYADSNGFQQDGDTWQWIWRDWLISALNDDMPFDQFTIWQLAGDLLPDPTNEQLIATAFNRNHMLNGEGGAIPEELRCNNLFDRVDTTATTWLGLTVACAQCHDHKYDPITQENYYQMMDLFNQVPEVGKPQFFSKRIRVESPLLELPTQDNNREITAMEATIEQLDNATMVSRNVAFAGWKAGLLNLEAEKIAAVVNADSDSSKAAIKTPADKRTSEENNIVESALRKHFNDKVFQQISASIPKATELLAAKESLKNYRNDKIPRVMVMSDDKPRQTHVFLRGAYLSPGDEVQFNTPDFLPSIPESFPKNRLGFAQWLMLPENPLTSRVQVNRMWQHFFGAGLVKTSEDFGVQSEYPIYKDLLDWLAIEFRENGWSVKAMHRLIVTSQTYKQSSRMNDWHRSEDLDNKLLSRGARFRMPAMILRDWALQSASLLNTEVGGEPVYPIQPDGVWDALAITKERDFTYPTSNKRDLYRRSIYTFWRRTVSPANMFDASSRQTCRVKSSTTCTPLHALTTLNDPTWVQAAIMLADKTLAVKTDADAAIKLALETVLCRPAQPSDLKHLRTALLKQRELFESNPQTASTFLSASKHQRLSQANNNELASVAAICLALFNLDEALTRE